MPVSTRPSILRFFVSGLGFVLTILTHPLELYHSLPEIGNFSKMGGKALFSPPSLAEGLPAFWVPLVAGFKGVAARPF